MEDQAERFLEFDYAETKDLCKHFLTVITAVLVFSITFSEKIIDFPKASILAKTLLLAAWGLLVVAIVGSGVGLYAIFEGGRAAKHGSPERVYLRLINAAYGALDVAGISFVLGLVALVATAVVSIYGRS